MAGLGDIFGSIGTWLGNAFHKVASAATTFITSLPLPGLIPPPPSGSNSGGGSSGTGTSGSGSGTSGTGSTGTGTGSGTSFTNLFTAPIEFFGHLMDKNTWLRVGLVMLGVVFIVVSARMFMRAEASAHRVDSLLDQVGA